MTRTKTLRTSYFSRPLFRVKVDGESMWPALVPGKTYWASGLLKPQMGDVIIFRNPKNGEQIFVKRVAAVRPEEYEVESLVSWGTSSGELGLVPQSAVLGTVI